eukprot:TRINITY_DN47235_c0_g1_i1.p1 TRINITY_DN47235_c0_g1~~TRINITY_DN47235_c0_g1_i1.p1  ORF type:complete len:347 (-),score=76.80 TRINITY_DN47235_c0_g1_i1:25-1065(-)
MEERAAGSQEVHHVYDSLIDRKEAKRMEELALALSDKAPPWAAKYLRKFAPALGVLWAGAEVVVPGIFRFYGMIYEWYCRLPKNLASCLWGLGICFFGGRYAVAIAAIEAFKSTGGTTMLTDVRDIAAELQKANEEDEQIDADEDGIADAKQIDGKSLLTRKCALVLKTVDPARLSRAVSALWSGYMGVLVVLKYKFAKTVTLAHSIGDTMRPAAAKFVGPTILTLTPEEYRKWVTPCINVGCKITAFMLAWRIQMVISTVQSGLKGGLIASRSMLDFLNERNIVALAAASSPIDDIAGWSLAAGGIYYQLFKGGPVPFYLAPVFWPMGILERFLQWSVTWDEVKA